MISKYLGVWIERTPLNHVLFQSKKIRMFNLNHLLCFCTEDRKRFLIRRLDRFVLHKIIIMLFIDLKFIIYRFNSHESLFDGLTYPKRKIDNKSISIKRRDSITIYCLFVLRKMQYKICEWESEMCLTKHFVDFVLHSCAHFDLHLSLSYTSDKLLCLI